MDHHLLIDANNVMFAAQAGSERRLMSGDVETTAIFGTLASARYLQKTFPNSKPTFLWDSSPTWRHEEYPEYKGNRDDNAELVKIKEALKPQRTELQKALQLLGIRQLSAKRYEADDMAGYLAPRLSKTGKVTVVTNDQDWLQLVSENVNWFDRNKEKLVVLENFQTFTGYTDPTAFLFGKCLRGDKGDNLPGVGGIGDKGAEALTAEFKDYADLLERWAEFEPTIPKSTPLSRIRKHVTELTKSEEKQANFARNQRMMNLMEVDIPREAMRSLPAMYDEDAFKEFCAEMGLMSILQKYEEFVSPFNNKR